MEVEEEEEEELQEKKGKGKERKGGEETMARSSKAKSLPLPPRSAF